MHRMRRASLRVVNFRVEKTRVQLAGVSSTMRRGIYNLVSYDCCGCLTLTQTLFGNKIFQEYSVDASGVGESPFDYGGVKRHGLFV